MAKKRDHYSWLDYGIDMDARAIYLGSDINERSAAQAIKGLMALNWVNAKPITLVINSGGGILYDGNAIYDAVKASKANVTGVVIGCAMSAAAQIFEGCDRRIMMPNARLMFHQSSWRVNDEVRNFKAWATEASAQEKWQEAMLAEIAFGSEEAARAFLATDAIVDAETAVELGLADEIARAK